MTEAETIDAIMAFGRDELGIVLYDWHDKPIRYALSGKYDGLHVRYRSGGKTTVAWMVNTYLKREDIRSNEIPHDGSCLRCGHAPVGESLLCGSCRFT